MIFPPLAAKTDGWHDALVSAPPMSRRSLRPHLNQIRGWVRQGRTDAWIAHQLEVTVQQIEAFKKDNDLMPDDDGQEGYGLWLDPAVEDNPVYAEHWAGHRPVTVTIEEDQIVIRRAGDEDE